jgi:hypothetical protein
LVDGSIVIKRKAYRNFLIRSICTSIESLENSPKSRSLIIIRKGTVSLSRYTLHAYVPLIVSGPKDPEIPVISSPFSPTETVISVSDPISTGVTVVEVKCPNSLTGIFILVYLFSELHSLILGIGVGRQRVILFNDSS